MSRSGRPPERRARPREARAKGPVAASFAEIVARIGANVRALRHARGLTQEQLAERAELSTVGVAFVERGRTNVTMGTLTQLAHALNVEVESLLKRTSTARSPADTRLAANPAAGGRAARKVKRRRI